MHADKKALDKRILDSDSARTGIKAGDNEDDDEAIISQQTKKRGLARIFFKACQNLTSSYLDDQRRKLGREQIKELARPKK